MLVTVRRCGSMRATDGQGRPPMATCATSGRNWGRRWGLIRCLVVRDSDKGFRAFPPLRDPDRPAAPTRPPADRATAAAAALPPVRDAARAGAQAAMSVSQPITGSARARSSSRSASVHPPCDELIALVGVAVRAAELLAQVDRRKHLDRDLRGQRKASGMSSTVTPHGGAIWTGATSIRSSRCEVQQSRDALALAQEQCRFLATDRRRPGRLGRCVRAPACTKPVRCAKPWRSDPQLGSVRFVVAARIHEQRSVATRALAPCSPAKPGTVPYGAASRARKPRRLEDLDHEPAG